MVEDWKESHKMRKLEWGKYTNTCSVCKTLGHNRTTCPKVPELAEKCKEIMDSGVRLKQIVPTLASAYEESELRKLRKQKKVTLTKPRKCSFCREGGHTKRNCPGKTVYKNLLYEANRAWRRIFLKDVNKVGLGVGCLVAFELTQGTMYAVVQSIPWSTMSFMALYQGRWEYQTDYKIDLMSTSGDQAWLQEWEVGGLTKTAAIRLNNVSAGQVSIITPATSTAPEGWVESKKVGAIEWLINEHSAEQLQDYRVVKLAREIIKLFP